MLDLVLLFVGLAFLIFGSHLLLNSLRAFSLKMGLSPLFLSIVVLGFASSAPEWFVTLTAVLKDRPSAALGNIFGSNIINILLILSLTGLLFRLSFERQILRFDFPVLISSILLLGLCALDGRIDWQEGLVFLSGFSIYLRLLFQTRRWDGQDPTGPQTKDPTAAEGNSFTSKKLSFWFKLAGSFLFGFVFLFAGSSLGIEASLNLVHALSLSEKFAGVFILSLSTSLPELFTSIQAGFKKEGEMALGNIVGSNIFNTLFVPGTASLIKTFSAPQELWTDWVFMTLVSLVLWFKFLFFKGSGKLFFAGFILLYFVYIARSAQLI